MISALEALERLRDGNRRFVSGARSGDEHASRGFRSELVTGQEPFAVILGCSDSRVPVELVFDLGLGELFVIRVAGNVAAPTQMGSVEFAVKQLGTRLVVVLGHTGCAAVGATLRELRDSSKISPGYFGSVINHIRPALEPLLTSQAGENPDELAGRAVRENILATAHRLRHGSEILRNLVRHEGLLVVGAEYSLETGSVDFFDVPDSAG